MSPHLRPALTPALAHLVALVAGACHETSPGTFADTPGLETSDSDTPATDTPDLDTAAPDPLDLDTAAPDTSGPAPPPTPPCSPDTCLACEAHGCDPIVALAPGPDAACAVLASGDALCWGNSRNNLFGDALRELVRPPTRVIHPAPIAGLWLSDGWACARPRDPSLRPSCWGDNLWRHLHPSARLVLEPTPIHLDFQDEPAAQPTVGPLGTLCLGTASTTLCSGLLLTGHEDLEAGPSSPTPVPVDALPPLAALHLGDYFGCGLSTVGGVHCFGSHRRGQLGLGALPGDPDTPVPGSASARPVPLPRSTHRLAVGPTHACAALSPAPPSTTSEILCWGELAPGLRHLLPTPLAAVEDLHALVAGHHFTCALSGSTSQLTCWGPIAALLPTPAPSHIGLIAAGHDSLLFTIDGALYHLQAGHPASVDPSTGQVTLVPVRYESQAPPTCPAAPSSPDPDPDPGPDPATTPWLAPGEPHPSAPCLRCAPTGALASCPLGCAEDTCRTPIALSAAERHTCALTDDGALICWGDLAALDRPDPDGLPRLIDGLPPLASFHTADTWACGLSTSHTLVCTGDSPPRAEALLSDCCARDEPPSDPGMGLDLDVLALALGPDHLCALLDAEDAQRVACRHRDGRLIEHALPDTARFDLLASTHAALCVAPRFGSSGQILCAPITAPNDRGAPGDPGEPSPLVPVPGNHFSVLDLLAAGPDRLLASSGRFLYRWQLPSPPVQFAMPRGQPTALTAGAAFSCALDLSGLVRCSGDNRHGQLGAHALAPATEELVDIASLPPARHIAAGARHVCAITHAAEVLCWGDNRHGQLGRGAGASWSPLPRPVAVPRSSDDEPSP